MDSSTLVEITEPALEQILALREQETIALISISGFVLPEWAQTGSFYETAFLRPEDVSADDHLEHHGDLSVAYMRRRQRGQHARFCAGSRRATRCHRAWPAQRKPSDATYHTDGDVELERIEHPRSAKAAHRAVYQPVDRGPRWLSHLVPASTATVLLSSSVAVVRGVVLRGLPLRQGIEASIKHHVPEIVEAVDVTDHSAGENPFFA